MDIVREKKTCSAFRDVQDLKVVIWPYVLAAWETTLTLNNNPALLHLSWPCIITTLIKNEALKITTSKKKC